MASNKSIKAFARGFVNYTSDQLAGRTIRDININAEYLLLRVGSTDSRGDTFQAFAVNQMTHRLWSNPQTVKNINVRFKSGRIQFVD